MIWIGREARYRYFPRLDRVFLLLIFLLLFMPLSIPLNLYGSAVKISFFCIGSRQGMAGSGIDYSVAGVYSFAVYGLSVPFWLC